MVMAGLNAAVETNIGEFMARLDYLFFAKTKSFCSIVRLGFTTVIHGEFREGQETLMKVLSKEHFVRQWKKRE
jgi:hypothetical protein